MQPEPQGHVVLFPYEGWGMYQSLHQAPNAPDTISSPGHLRPLTVLAARIVKARPTYVTFLTTHRFIDHIQGEISRNIDSDDGANRALIRCVHGTFGHDEAMD